MNDDEECGFIKAWIGPCDNPRPCKEHGAMKCCVCKEPATHECPATRFLVCGYPLCDGCEHEDGDGYRHVRKEE